MKKKQHSVKTTGQKSQRVAAPTEPVCFEKTNFKRCAYQVFYIFSMFIQWERIGLSGGGLSRQLCSDLDFKLPNCTQQEINAVVSYFKNVRNFTTNYQRNLPLLLAFNQLLLSGGKLKKCYAKKNRAVLTFELNNILLDFVLFEESFKQHATTLDLSINAGFYHPNLPAIYFPIDDTLELNESGELVPCDRTAKDFLNRQLNLVFPEQYQRIFNEDPIRMLHVVKALSRSDFVLSQRLQEDLAVYIQSNKKMVFSSVNSDRLYYNIKQLFFSGHAVNNLKHLIELNLLEELFLNLNDVSESSKAFILYLIQRVAEESDKNVFLPPSVLFYAVFLDRIKDIAFTPYIISDCSNGRFSLPIHADASNANECLTQDIHNNNIDHLMRYEEDYQSLYSNKAVVATHSPELPSDNLAEQLFCVTLPYEKENILQDSPELPIPSIKKQKIRGKKVKKQPVEENPDLVYTDYCQQATALLNEKKYKDAKKIFENAIQLNKTLPDAYRGLGKLFEQQANDLNKAVEAVINRIHLIRKEPVNNKKMLAKNKQDYDELQRNRQDKLQQAKGYYEKAVLMNPADEQSIDLCEKITKAIQEVSLIVLAEEPNTMASVSKKPKEVEKNKIKKSKNKQKKIDYSPRDITVDVAEQANNTDEWLLELAQAKKEEKDGCYQQAVTGYNRLFVKHHVIDSGYKCVELYEKLKRYDDAYRYATKLINLSESDYDNLYQTKIDTVANSYQYHHHFSLYQRAKIGLMLSKKTQSTADFDCILNLYLDHGSSLHPSLLDLVVQSHIQLGNYYHTSVVKWDSVGKDMLKFYANSHYSSALEIVHIIGDACLHRLSDIYLGLGDIERKDHHFDGEKGANNYYEKALDVINEQINDDAFSYESIGEVLYQYARHVGEDLINMQMEQLLSNNYAKLSQQDHWFLDLVNDVCTSSLIYTGNTPQKAHLFLIKKDLIMADYDECIVKINYLMQLNENKTQLALKQADTCQRELLLLLGVCHEKKLAYEKAIFFYNEAQKICRYNDDNDSYEKLIQLAVAFAKRCHKLKKGALSFYSNENPSKNSLTQQQANDLKEAAFVQTVSGKMAQQEGNIELAHYHYKQYLSSIRTHMNLFNINNDSSGNYDVFYHFANMIIPADTIGEALRVFLLEECDPSSMIDLNYLELVHDIYLEAVNYSNCAHFDLLVLEILGKQYKAAIERMNLISRMDLKSEALSIREMNYIRAKLYEAVALYPIAEIFYKKAALPLFSDDNSLSGTIIQMSNVALKRIICKDTLPTMFTTSFVFFTPQPTRSVRMASVIAPTPVVDLTPSTPSSNEENHENVSIFS